MVSKINFSFCIILFFLCSLVFGKSYNFIGFWRGEAKRCSNEGGATYINTFDIGSLDSVLAYDAVNNTAVTEAAGTIELRLGATADYNTYRSMKLDKYTENYKGKSFFGNVTLTGINGAALQIVYVKLTMLIHQNSNVTLRTEVSAKSVEARSCCRAKFSIPRVTIYN